MHVGIEIDVEKVSMSICW